MSVIPAWDTYAFFQALVLGGIAWLVTLWVTPLEEFSSWDWFFVIGVPGYVYLKNAKSSDEQQEGITGVSVAAENKVKMGPKFEKLERLVMVKGGAPVPYAERAATVLISFATTCAPSRQSFRGLNGSYKVFRDDGVDYLAVSREAPDVVHSFLDDERRGSNTVAFKVASDPDGAALRSLKKRLEVKNTPHVFVVTRQGNVAWHGHPNALEGMLSAILAREETFSEDEDEEEEEGVGAKKDT
mmetsp:Transcript_23672/g.74485  ORF Transcript_23672/g.74485 Transcript_23672/m.74485 type:complete len:242 (-) Transcript_23672:2075-2800(-)